MRHTVQESIPCVKYTIEKYYNARRGDNDHIATSFESLELEASLTKKQVEYKRQKFSDECDEGMAEENNVISLCAFRNR